jgi:hypothetical protein
MPRTKGPQIENRRFDPVAEGKTYALKASQEAENGAMV